MRRGLKEVATGCKKKQKSEDSRRRLKEASGG
jgi:hypothetical protein